MITAVECATCGTRNAPGVETCVGCGRALAERGPAEQVIPPPGPTGAPSGDAWPPPPDPGSVPPDAPGAPVVGGPVPPPAAPGPYTPGGYPSGGYPSGGYPPGGEPPPPPYAPGPGPGQPAKGSRSGLLLGLAVFVVVALVAAAAFVVLTKDDGGSDEVVLEPIDMVQEDDFAGNLDVGESAGAAFGDLETSEDVPDARVEQVDTPLAGRVVDGAEPAVYGGSRDTQVCDVAALTEFLTDPDNADKTEAWAGALGVEVADVETYISGLTAVRLRWDTRVTNHGFSDGEANAFQALLQAGTAVLVDDTGVPRVKCNCGNPLGEPTGLGGASESSALDVDDVAQNPDAAWDGLDPSQAVSIQPGATVEAITLVDVDTGGLIERRVGSDGVSERDAGTGDVQLTLSWASDADLDLAVIEPDGNEIYFSAKTSPSGGELDVDANVGCDNDGSLENIFWPSGEAPPGSYTVKVTGYEVDGCGSGDFTLDITVGGEESTETGTVGEDEEVTFDIEVP